MIEQMGRTGLVLSPAQIQEDNKQATNSNIPQKPEQLSLRTTEGYETLVKEMQYYLLYALPEILDNADNYYNDLTVHERIKKVTVNDDTGNTSLISKLARAGGTSVMRKIPPNILSYLVPMIKIYKVTYENNKEYSCIIPFDDNAVPYGQNINDILSPRKGGLDLANIVSFNYQLVGTNPAESETNITANLKLKFQTIDALLDKRLLPTENRTKVLEFRYADLVNQAKRGEPGYYRLKIKVGYQLIDKKTIENLLINGENIYDIAENSNKKSSVNEMAEKFENAINHSNLFLYVYPVAHELNFNDNGTIDLSIDFRGAIETTLVDESSNILITDEDTKEAKQRIEQAKEQNKLEASQKSESDSDAEKKQKIADQNLKNAYAKSDSLYNSFIEKLYNSGKIKSIAFDKNYFGAEENRFSADSIINNSTLRRDLLNKTDRIANLNYRSLNDPNKIDEMIKALKSKVKENKGEQTSSGASSTNEGKSIGLTLNEGTIPDSINFIFLKDIYEIALNLDDIKKKFDEDNIHIILGNIMLPASKGYANFAQIKQTSKLFSSAGVSSDNVSYIQYNIANLPISLEYFNKWYFETIVRPGRTEWKFKNFFYDLMELIRIATMNIFGSKVTGTPGSRTLLGMASVDNTKFNNIISNSEEINFKEIKTEITPPRSASDVANILYLYTPAIMTNKIDPLHPSEMEDKYNLFTFTVGSNSGLMKKISYKKMEIQGLRESRSSREGELESGTFRMKYDADIDMYGPCYFLPGDYIIINPIFLSKSTTRKAVETLANDLGLGGIYMVLKTNTEASRDGINTKLDTVFQGYGTLTQDKKLKAAQTRGVNFSLVNGIDPALIVDREALNEDEKIIFDETAEKALDFKINLDIVRDSTSTKEMIDAAFNDRSGK